MMTEKWKDPRIPLTESATSASANVFIMDPSFYLPQLNRTRRIWLYLPADYFTVKKKYPVLYMQDGQNLFDEQTSFSGEWGVDETLDAMQPGCIVVGIDNGGVQRMTEYNPHDNQQQGKGEGIQYLEFIVKTLKPYIDKHYRTLKTKKHTFIAGSSMGGLISFYAGLYYPKVFGSIGVLSPSFWIVPQIKEELALLTKKKKYADQFYFFYVGGEEGNSMVTGMLYVSELMKTYTKATLKVIVTDGEQHNERAWGRIFPDFYTWTMNE